MTLCDTTNCEQNATGGEGTGNNDKKTDTWGLNA